MQVTNIFYIFFQDSLQQDHFQQTSRMENKVRKQLQRSSSLRQQQQQQQVSSWPDLRDLKGVLHLASLNINSCQQQVHKPQFCTKRKIFISFIIIICSLPARLPPRRPEKTTWTRYSGPTRVSTQCS